MPVIAGAPRGDRAHDRAEARGGIPLIRNIEHP